MSFRDDMSSVSGQRKNRPKLKKRQEYDSDDEIILAHPNRDRDEHVKTLYEIAAERESELFAAAEAAKAAKNRSNASKNNSNNQPGVAVQTMPTRGSHKRDTDSPLFTAALYASTLTMCHFTLTLLVHQQFAQLDSLPPNSALAIRSLTQAFPALFALIYLAHHETLLRPLGLHPAASTSKNPAGILVDFRSLLFVVTATVAGLWLVKVGNEERYLAVMEKTPGLAVIWIWCLMELSWIWGLTNLLFVAGVATNKGWKLW